jgi:hypothetical protein
MGTKHVLNIWFPTQILTTIAFTEAGRHPRCGGGFPCHYGAPAGDVAICDSLVPTPSLGPIWNGGFSGIPEECDSFGLMTSLTVWNTGTKVIVPLERMPSFTKRRNQNIHSNSNFSRKLTKVCLREKNGGIFN